MKNFYKKGVTAIELLIVVAVLAIIFAIVFPQFSQMRENQALKTAVSDVLSSLNKARSQTLSSLNSSEYGVRFEPDRVIIFTGQSYSSEALDNETINIITPATISNVTLNDVSASVGDMFFNRLSGSPSKKGTITISTASRSKIITISATGVAN